MSLINFGGFGPSPRSIERRMNQLMNHMYQDFPSTGSLSSFFSDNNNNPSSNFISPAVSLYETDKQWVIHAECPGVKKEDIKVDVNGDTMTISGETKFDQQYTKENTRYQERREGTFSRTLTVPENVDRDKINAKYENGILEITMLKSDQAKPSKKITVH